MAPLTLKQHIHIGAYCGFTNQLYIYTLNVFGLALTGILIKKCLEIPTCFSFSSLGLLL